jgi:transposase-like protein
MKRRRFTQYFKRSIVEQLLTETTGPAELCRCCNISSGQLNSWKRQYADGKLDPEPFRKADHARKGLALAASKEKLGLHRRRQPQAAGLSK